MPKVHKPVCIIGAGSSGVAAAKALKQKGVAFECFEIGSDIGGMWRYENDNGQSSAYRSLHIDTSRGNLGYPDHPIPDRYPDFLSHAQVLEWLESYADRFDLKRHFRFRCKVESVTPETDGSWRVTISRTGTSWESTSLMTKDLMRAMSAPESVPRSTKTLASRIPCSGPR